MPKKYLKKRAPKRRRTQVKEIATLAPTAMQLARAGYEAYKGYKAVKDAQSDNQRRKKSSKPRRVVAKSLTQTDNICTVRATIIGKRKPLTFDERVARVDRPPILFKRNYEFNAEGISGRKSWFSFEFNQMNNTDLGGDLTTYKAQQYTDTGNADLTVGSSQIFDGAKFYVDYLSEKLQLVNSSSNSMIGKIHLYAHKRDNDNSYAGVPITPINLMMYYSSNRLPGLTTNLEAVVGNGWKFDTTTSGANYLSIYNMPGSALHPATVTAQTDFALSPSSPHIAESMNFWFRHVDTFDFSLKPGQQINKTYIFNDLQNLMREEQAEFAHIANVSYSCVVEFRGGIVGTLGSPTNEVSTGTSQMSVMRESKRIIGIKNKLKSKVYLQTSAPVIITQANQQIINPDTGTQLTGAQLD